MRKGQETGHSQCGLLQFPKFHANCKETTSKWYTAVHGQPMPPLIGKSCWGMLLGDADMNLARYQNTFFVWHKIFYRQIITTAFYYIFHFSRNCNVFCSANSGSYAIRISFETNLAIRSKSINTT